MMRFEHHNLAVALILRKAGESFST